MAATSGGCRCTRPTTPSPSASSFRPSANSLQEMRSGFWKEFGTVFTIQLTVTAYIHMRFCHVVYLFVKLICRPYYMLVWFKGFIFCLFAWVEMILGWFLLVHTRSRRCCSREAGAVHRVGTPAPSRPCGSWSPESPKPPRQHRMYACMGPSIITYYIRTQYKLYAF